MNTEFRRAMIPGELRSLVIFDHKAFHQYQADWFDPEYWTICEPWWMIVAGRKVGCCAFERNVDFRHDLEDGHHPCPGSLYISSTGILPALQRQGLGKLLKQWQITYARHHGFHRIITNHRASNHPIIKLNQDCGFQIIRTTPDYYADPVEAAVVMELKLT